MDKIFVIKIQDAPEWLSVSNFSIALRNYFETGYSVQEVFPSLTFEEKEEE